LLRAAAVQTELKARADELQKVAPAERVLVASLKKEPVAASRERSQPWLLAVEGVPKAIG
jgi:hypothetical protein